MRLVRACLLALVLSATLASGTVQAAEPSAGTLSSKTRTLRWSGTITVSEPTLVVGCVSGSTGPVCDPYELRVNMREGTRVRITLPSPNAATDLDLIVYAPTGGEVGSSGNLPGETESVEFRHNARYGTKPYTVVVKPFLAAPGTTYTATAKVV